MHSICRSLNAPRVRICVFSACVSQPWSPDSDVIGLRLEPRQEHVHAAQLVRTDNPLFDKVMMAFATVVDEVKQLERTVWTARACPQCTSLCFKMEYDTRECVEMIFVETAHPCLCASMCFDMCGVFVWRCVLLACVWQQTHSNSVTVLAFVRSTGRAGRIDLLRRTDHVWPSAEL